MFTMPRFEGAIQPGMVFRHRAFDIRCEVVEVTGFQIIVKPIDCEGNRSEDLMDHTVGSFRQNWSVERRAEERWAAKVSTSV